MSATATVLSPASRTAPLYERVKSVIPPIEWPVFADDIEAILDAEAPAQRGDPGAQLPDARRSSTASPTSSATAWRWRARR